MTLARHLLVCFSVLALVACDDAASTGNSDTTSTDTTSTDTTSTDTTPTDTTIADSTPADTNVADTTAEDATPADTNVADTSPDDVPPADTNIADTTPADTNVADTTPADTASPGACNNESDLATLRAEETTLAGKIQACVFQCLASGASCSSNCLQQSTELSSGCADCFGEVIACTITNCATQCFDATSQACTTCRNQYCTPAFESCAGIEQP